MGRVEIYYGMSGTFKTTTINKKHKNEVIIISAIKDWKHFRTKLFPWLVGETNLNYSLLHLVRLKDSMEKSQDYIIERGITDSLYYEYQKQPTLITPSIISSAVKQESDIISNVGNVHKILLTMHDEKFIAEKVLSEITRAECFQGVEDYMKKQEDYVKFTKAYNDITEIIEIKDAREYLESLGIEYNV